MPDYWIEYERFGGGEESAPSTHEFTADDDKSALIVYNEFKQKADAQICRGLQPAIWN